MKRPPGFCILPAALKPPVWTGLTPKAKAVAGAVAFHMNNKKRQCDPGARRLMETSGLKSERSVREALAELRRKGVLIVRRRRRGTALLVWSEDWEENDQSRNHDQQVKSVQDQQENSSSTYVNQTVEQENPPHAGPAEAALPPAVEAALRGVSCQGKTANGLRRHVASLLAGGLDGAPVTEATILRALADVHAALEGGKAIANPAAYMHAIVHRFQQERAGAVSEREQGEAGRLRGEEAKRDLKGRADAVAIELEPRLRALATAHRPEAVEAFLKRPHWSRPDYRVELREPGALEAAFAAYLRNCLRHGRTAPEPSDSPAAPGEPQSEGEAAAAAAVEAGGEDDADLLAAQQRGRERIGRPTNSLREDRLCSTTSL